MKTIHSFQVARTSVSELNSYHMRQLRLNMKVTVPRKTDRVIECRGTNRSSGHFVTQEWSVCCPSSSSLRFFSVRKKALGRSSILTYTSDVTFPYPSPCRPFINTYSSSRHPPQLTEARILSLNTTSSLAHPHPCNKGTHLNYLVPTPLLPNILPSSSLFTPSRPPFRAPERAHRPAACWRAQGKGSSWGEGCGEQPEGDPVEIGGI
mmetsp:Transcript_38582/g.75764  ORF Transcript_38582/g.75764 Transcript_38582/m.75764 type:complete len:207 (-) Transcript_38582:212-832(-)